MQYSGKYFGLVRDTNDPEQRGRIRLFCPEVMGGIDNADQWLDWALPCFPWFVNQGIGLNFIPPKGDIWGVWVEFRQCDIKYPIWTGVFPLGSLHVDKTKTTLQSESGSAATVDSNGVTLLPGSGSINLGDTDSNLIDLQDGVVHGRGIDLFAGTSYFALGNTSAVVKAKK